MHLFHLGISIFLEECRVAYLSSLDTEMSASGHLGQGHKVRPCKTAILNRCNSISAAFRNDFVLSYLHVDYFACQKSEKLNDFFTRTEVRGLLEGKYCSASDMLFAFVAPSIHRVTGYSAKPQVTEVYTIYSAHGNALSFRIDGLGFLREISKVAETTAELK